MVQPKQIGTSLSVVLKTFLFVRFGLWLLSLLSIHWNWIFRQIKHTFHTRGKDTASTVNWEHPHHGLNKDCLGFNIKRLTRNVRKWKLGANMSPIHHARMTQHHNFRNIFLNESILNGFAEFCQTLNTILEIFVLRFKSHRSLFLWCPIDDNSALVRVLGWRKSL